VDPGAWANLVGVKMAREMTKRAMTAGRKVRREKMDMLHDQGVGDRSQSCKYKMICPISAAHADGELRMAQITAPVAEETGEDLPGLLGLRSLEQMRAIGDCGGRKLYIPGPGEIQVILPPGSNEIPSREAPPWDGPRTCI
jgi:hypothetical protein